MRVYAIERSTAEWCTILHALEAAAPYDDYQHVEKIKADIRAMLRHDDNHCYPDEPDVALPERIENAAHVQEQVRNALQAANYLDGTEVEEVKPRYPTLAARIKLVAGWMQRT